MSLYTIKVTKKSKAAYLGGIFGDCHSPPYPSVFPSDFQVKRKKNFKMRGEKVIKGKKDFFLQKCHYKF